MTALCAVSFAITQLLHKYFEWHFDFLQALVGNHSEFGFLCFYQLFSLIKIVVICNSLLLRISSSNMLKNQYINLEFGLPVTIFSRTLHPLILLAGRKRMAVEFPSGLQSRKCPDPAENMSSVLVKLSVYDANVQRLASLPCTDLCKCSEWLISKNYSTQIRSYHSIQYTSNRPRWYAFHKTTKKKEAW